MRYLLTNLLLSFALGLAAQTEADLWRALAPRSIGPAGMSGRVTSIDVHPTDRDLIYVGTASGGVWRSDNGGTSFRPIFDDQPYLGIGAVAVAPSQPSVIWVGTGEGNPRNSANYGGGIFRSADGGATWEARGLAGTRHIHRLIVHPTNPDVVYAGAMGNMWAPNEERGVYRTTDGGRNWERVLYVDEGTGIADLVLDPSNPDKLIAATWTFDRDPWFFNSGGRGSGLWVTTDGGENWTRRTAKDGLPKGNLGRIGLAVAASNPQTVYALVEAKVNGLYKSTDGAKTFQLVSEKNIGNRPFYYADIYVDPTNENTLYNVYTYLSKSEDAGRTFRQIADYGNDVHPDHHAFWIDPDNPDHIIEGNDGGLNISHDAGRTWRFAENLPLAQFYHINHDLSVPYLVGGGMQDNGSWVGPSRGLKSGGITDADWQEVYFGDGFDLIFHPTNPDLVYAASQGGYLGRIHRSSGKSKLIRPVHPQDSFLRFNWNAPIAQDPRNPDGLYMGSQFVHKSADLGDSWTIISPDLTTNDTSKQHADRSGGLTIDATQAENHTTLLAIVPAHVGYGQPQALWVGSDDGRLHYSPDDGGEWRDLTGALEAAGMAPASWIGYIEASPHDPETAFVVVNDYRRGDTRPMVFRTDDLGQTFTKMVSERQVSGHAQALVQDPVEPNLFFLGTDQGLWYSLDGGRAWTRFDAGFPHVSVMDLKIHPREHDLIIGTFGRAAWILDDIRPFRKLSSRGRALLGDSLATFPLPDAYQFETRSYQGIRFSAQGRFSGQDRPEGALLTYWIRPGGPADTVGAGAQEPYLLEYSRLPKTVQEDVPGRENSRMEQDEAPYATATAGPDPVAPPRGKVKFQIVDPATGDTIRTFTRKARWGFNRTSWDFRRDGTALPSRRKRKADADPPAGPTVAPGVYRVVISYRGHRSSETLTVHPDPREPYVHGQFAARDALQERLDTAAARVTRAFGRLQDTRRAVARVRDLSKSAPRAERDSLTAHADSLLQSVAELEELLMEPKGLKGIQRNPTNLQAKLYRALGYVSAVEGTPSQLAEFSLRHFEDGAADFVRRVEAFERGELARFRKHVSSADLDPFGE